MVLDLPAAVAAKAAMVKKCIFFKSRVDRRAIDSIEC